MTSPATFAEFLAPLPGVHGLGPSNQILLVAYFLRATGRTDFTTGELRSVFHSGRLPPPDALDIRVQQLTGGLKPRLMRVRRGRYSLSIYGVREVEEYLTGKQGTKNAARILEDLIGRVSEDAQRRFIAESVACLKVGAKRAGVVMTWLLTIDHLYEFILRHKLAEFNAALAAMLGANALQIATKDDFGDLREVQFIQAARTAKLISNDQRKILEEKLGIRNTCAHPTTVEIHDSKVVNFVEDLVDNVILRFTL
jgi:hypothetical protein